MHLIHPERLDDPGQTVHVVGEQEVLQGEHGRHPRPGEQQRQLGRVGETEEVQGGRVQIFQSWVNVNGEEMRPALSGRRVGIVASAKHRARIGGRRDVRDVHGVTERLYQGTRRA